MDTSGSLTTSVASNATLTGNGTFKGALNILSGGKLSPGTSIGKIVLSNAPVLQGATIIEPRFLPLPHPSPRNKLWLKRNPWFEAVVLPHLRQRVPGLL